MTIGELIDEIARIKEFEKGIEHAMEYPDEYIDAGSQVEKLENLINICRSKDIV